MAYVRWSTEEGPHPYVSDIYIHADIRGGYSCCGCRLNKGREERFEEWRQIRDHLDAHQEAGHAIPVWMFYQVHLEPDDRVWTDTTIEELTATARQQGAKVLSWDADVPEDVLDDMSEFQDVMARAIAEKQAMTTMSINGEFTIGMSLPTDSEESSTSHPTEK